MISGATASIGTEATGREPPRGDLLTLPQLAERARQLAAEHARASRSVRVAPLLDELRQARADLIAIYEQIEASARQGHDQTPAEEWLLDNFHIVQEQLREIADDLPPGYLAELPRLTEEPWLGYPRVLALAVDFLAHTDARLDRENLLQYLQAYQEITPLLIGELWAIPIMLRIGLIANIRRLARLEVAARDERRLADHWADRLVAQARQRASRGVVALAELASSEQPLSDGFVAQLLKRVRDQDLPMGTVLAWIEERVEEAGSTTTDVIRHERHRQAVNQVSVGNSITSMRLIGALNWSDFFEHVSLVERELRRDPSGAYGSMHLATRDTYRRQVERLAAGSGVSEVETATRAVNRAAAEEPEETGGDRQRHVGYFLVDAGRPAFEAELGYRPRPVERLRRLVLIHPLTVYFGSIAALLLVLVALPLMFAVSVGSGLGLLALTAALLVLPASEVAISLVNFGITSFLRPRILPKLDLEDGIPDRLRTLVVVPTLLTGPESTRKLVDDLEIRFLANQDPNLLFALLTDFPDADRETQPGDDESLEVARQGIEELDRRYAGGHGDRFLLLHRRRRWNPRQRAWIGWERKRGKLEELNRLLRGADPTGFDLVAGDRTAIRDVRYVITLDTDTQLPRGAARRLVATIAHPLNQAVFDPALGRVVEGYGLIQPRVSTSLVSAGRSLFSRVFTGNTGLDPYTTAVSDIYQDLFGEGSYYGKGIYDVDAFLAALDGRVPEDRLLSHDLFEGLFVRAGLASDIELLDDYPAHYLVYAGRQHRWARGDWQLLPWLLPWAPSPEGRRPNDVPALGRWKLFDNLRRGLLAPSILALLAASWIVLPGSDAFWTALVLAAIALPIFAHLAGAFLRSDGGGWTSYLRGFWGDIRPNVLQVLITLAFLPDQALLMLDAIGRTIWRLLVTRRDLLEWETAAEAERRVAHGLVAIWQRMLGATTLTGVALALVVAFRPSALPLALPFVVLWLLAPVVADRISQPIPTRIRQVSDEDARLFRRTARKTWRFFETFVTAADHWLPPDNYQEDPKGVLARRTSPTNIGLYLLSALAARDFGYISLAELTGRVEDTLDTLESMERYRGHLYNWYDTATLQPLQPHYISTVDSGNLVGHLLALAQGCREATRAPLLGTKLLTALDDALDLLQQSLTVATAGSGATGTGEYRDVGGALDDLAGALVEARIEPPTTILGWRALLDRLLPLAETVDVATKRGEASAVSASGDVAFWSERIVELVRAERDELDALAPLSRSGARSNLCSDVIDIGVPSLVELTDHDGNEVRSATALRARLERVAERAVAFADAHDFRLLYDPSLRLFSIGFNLGTGQLDGSSYDLLASEARLASLVAIAMNQAPQSHWFRLGRQLAPAAGGRALLSWSGTMFEYLMPLLVMRRYGETLLDETYDAVVARQIEYGARHGVPWGISESAFNILDLALNYQYRAFGVPGLGLKPGLAEDLVVAPYATVLALMVDPSAAADNLRGLAREGMDGRFGFYEAIDYTPARVPPGRRAVVVRAFMAHHQGMSLIAIDNVLHGDPMIRRFHADPRVQATELLLQERVPGPVELAEVRAADAPTAAPSGPADLGPTERVARLAGPIPSTMVLSNGTYTVLVTGSGAGWSAYGEVDVTRWREDSTIPTGGTYCYVRVERRRSEVDGHEAPLTARYWSAALQPTLVQPDEYHVVYTPDAAHFRRRDGDVETVTEIVVSPESNAEVRRVGVTNLGAEPISVELTSYAEVALAPHAADLAHPAFGNLFVQTELVPTIGALLCTRRPRKADDAPVWLVHVSAVEGRAEGLAEFETSRAHFIGRGRDPSRPVALDPGSRLSNTVGAVLDPALSIRRIVQLAPGERAAVSFITAAADSRQAALELANAFADPRAVSRAFELAWTDARVELRHLSLNAEQAHRFQELAASLLFNDPSRRAPPEVIAANRRGQPSLWPYGISGDRPIVLVRVDDPSSTELVHELLLAHEYWRLSSLSVDLVILNEDPGGYLQPLQDALLDMVRSSPAQGHLDQPGGVFVRRADLVPEVDQILLQAIARVVLLTSRGRLARQLARPPIKEPPRAEPTPEIRLGPDRGRAEPGLASISPDLQFFNGLGGFTADGREYVIELPPDGATPAPWANVIANPDFGFLVTESGAGFTWQGNSQTNRLTPWSNDPVIDPPGESIYLRDEEGGQIWSPTSRPSPAGGPYRVRHGQGYTRFEHRAFDVETELTLFVPSDDPVKVYFLRLRNAGSRSRRLSITAYVEWVLGTVRDRAAQHVVVERDSATGGLFARNHYTDPSGRVAFLASSDVPIDLTADRTELFGRDGTRARPRALQDGHLSGRVGAGLDPCGALRVSRELAPGEASELVFLLGQGRDADHARDLIQAYGAPERARAALDTAASRWDDLLGVVQARTPDPAFDLLVNRWLLYQSLACRFWARSAFYQSGGAYGFRDQLQDVLSFLFAAPEVARAQILRAAARQFVEGDVQHWWHPDSGQGVRTRCSDDLLWLPYAAAGYVEATGDIGILDESVPFLTSHQLEPDEDEIFGVPAVADEAATLYEHCRRAIERGITRGPHGLPLIGSGDWNDGMNRVGHEGRGESVWVAWFLASVLERFAPLADARGDAELARRYRAEARRLGTTVDEQAWDGAWYRRAYFDDGTPLGSATNDECTIDAIAQAWAVIAAVGDPERARQAMRAVEEHLVRAEDGLILLLTPPFDKTARDPGYIKGYLPGVRENGGQYTHGALWTILATALLGDGARAVELFGLINPINHAGAPDEVERYRVEPYVVAADVYGAAQHVGRGGWTWYTGSAGWMYRIAIEAILGLRLFGDRLQLTPTIPGDWPGFELRLRRGRATYDIQVDNSSGAGRGVRRIELDHRPLPGPDIPLVDDGAAHHVRVVLGPPEESAPPADPEQARASQAADG